VFPEIWDTVGPMLSGVLATGSASGSESELLPLVIDGKREDHWFDSTFNPITAEDGRVEGIFNIAVETTDRVRAERARLESERRPKEATRAAGLSSDFRALFEAAPIPLLVLAPPDWTIVATNNSRVQVTGVPREEVIGRKLFEAFPDDPENPDATGVQNLTASLARVMATRSDDVMAVQRYALRDPNGHFVEQWWSPVNTPVLGPDGEIALVIHRVEEVTDLVRLRGEAEAHDQLARDQQALIDLLRSTEAALRTEREHLGQMFEQAPGFIAMLQSPEHRFTLANAAYRKLTCLWS
jgi:PAS domain-containing protein